MNAIRTSIIDLEKEPSLENILRKLIQDGAFRTEFEENRVEVIGRCKLPQEAAAALMSLKLDTYLSSYSDLSPGVGGAII
jgi:hypothetical protein